MDNQLNEIFDLYNSILSNKSIISEQSAKTNIFGGVPFQTDNTNLDKKHTSSDWQNKNAVDFKVAQGTTLYSPVEGTVQRVDRTRTNTASGVFGVDVYVLTNDNKNQLYFSHLGDVFVSNNQKISKGSPIGTVSAPQDRAWVPLVHIGVKNGTIWNFIDNKGNIKTETTVTGGTSNIYRQTVTGQELGPRLAGESVIKESTGGLKLGVGQELDAGTFLISKDKNPKIKSAVNGVVKSAKFNSSCKNQIDVVFESDKKSYYLQYCGMDNLNVRPGSNVSEGDVLGTSSTSDVTVSLYDGFGNRESFSNLSKGFGLPLGIGGAAAGLGLGIGSKLKSFSNPFKSSGKSTTSSSSSSDSKDIQVYRKSELGSFLGPAIERQVNSILRGMKLKK